MHTSPRGWSYRDVVYARLLAWLRSKGMARPSAAERVALVRDLLAGAGTIFLVGDERVDRFTGQQAFDGLAELLDVFHLSEPIEGVSSSELWGPSLVRPSPHTYISPWVLGGEPCLENSRVPSAAVYALHHERGLGNEQIAALYPGVSLDAIEDALKLSVSSAEPLRPLEAVDASVEVVSLRSFDERLVAARYWPAATSRMRIRA
ncbi:MAG: DUF433 domain-containing protein [Egibacteraceae bacterium]